MKKLALAVLGSAFILSSVGFAQSTPYRSPYTSNEVTPATDYFRVNYFSSINAGASYNSAGTGTPLVTVTGATSSDEFIDIVNPGTNGAGSPANGSLCALIYVFDTAEELQECCGCLVTPDQLIELGVQRNLLSNPNQGVVVHSGAIKIISSAPTTAPSTEYQNSVCNASTPNPTPTLREWITHVRSIVSGPVGATTTTVGVTEVEFSDATLSLGAGSEEAFLATQCSNIQTQSTGHGICSCPTGAPTSGGGTIPYVVR